MKMIPLYKHITAHLDDQLRYTDKILPDEPTPSFPRPLGAEDAYFYTNDTPPNIEGAKRVIKLLRRYLADPSLANKQSLYQLLSTEMTASLCNEVVEAIDEEELGEIGYALARTMFYNATKREQLKFAYVLFGIRGMERIQKEDNGLWMDLVSIAHCEEFTFSFVYACGCKDFLPQDELWDLAVTTTGWGKVFVINELQCECEADQLWLLENGYDVEVDYPPLSIKLLELININYFLDQESLDHSAYNGAAAIINNLLLMLYDYDEEVLIESLSKHSFDCNRMLASFLLHSEPLAAEPEDILQVVGIAIGLSNLIGSQRYYLLTPNQTQTLLAECERLICLNDWKAYIEEHLFEKSDNPFDEQEHLNYAVCDLASELEIDVWPQLMEYYLVNPMETKLFPYLLGSTPDRLDMTLMAITNHLELYYGDADALLFPLRYLRNFPGKGEAIVHAALCSMHDLPRGIACALLDEWGPDYVTEYLREGLREARRLSNHNIVNARIDALLQGRQFAITDFIGSKQ